MSVKVLILYIYIFHYGLVIEAYNPLTRVPKIVIIFILKDSLIIIIILIITIIIIVIIIVIKLTFML